MTPEQIDYLEKRRQSTFSYLSRTEMAEAMLDTERINAPMLRKTYEWVKEEDAKKRRGERSEWNQGLWASQWANQYGCGTTCCIAGYVGTTFGQAEGLQWRGGEHLFDETGVRTHVSAYAHEALGLNTVQGNMLFYGSNEFEDVRQIIGVLVGEELL